MHAFTQRAVAISLVATMTFIVTVGAVEKYGNTDTVKIETPQNVAFYDVNDELQVDTFIDAKALNCMAMNMYFEARNQRTDDAMIAVGYTVLNRANHPRFPDNVCDVIYQARRDANGNPIRNRCQFSWACDGKPDVVNMEHPIERRAWERAVDLAHKVMTFQVDNPVGNATMYHATYVKPYWRRAYNRVTQIETHIFYEPRT